MNGEFNSDEEQSDIDDDEDGNVQNGTNVDDNDDINDATEFGLKPVLDLQKRKKMKVKIMIMIELSLMMMI